MMRKLPCLAVLLAGLVTLLPAQAANEKIRPKAGLWRIDSQTALFGHVVPDAAALVSLGPQALQDHVEQILRQNRVRLEPDGSASACVTAEQVAANRFVNDYGSGCIVSKPRRSGNILMFDITCGAPKGFGTTRVQFLDKSTWKATTHLELLVRGILQQIDNVSYGTWVSKQCPAGL